jgi:hypothetical protein
VVKKKKKESVGSTIYYSLKESIKVLSQGDITGGGRKKRRGAELIKVGA